MQRINNFYLLVIALFFIVNSSCSTPSPVETSSSSAKKNLSRNNALIKIDSAKVFLKNGELVLRKGNDIISEMFTMLNKTDKSFSHCGIAFYEQNDWWVYHSIGGEDNPDQILKRERFAEFVSASNNDGFGICDLSLKKTHVLKLHDIVDSLFRKKVPFDMKFDLKSNDRLYCAEMVYKSIRTATNNEQEFSLTELNGFQYVSTDNLFVNKQAQILCHVSY
jgi:hypothetical protein